MSSSTSTTSSTPASDAKSAAPVLTPFVCLMYNYVPDVVEKRPAHRPAHLEYIGEAHKRGFLMMGGAFNPVSEGALLIFNVADGQTKEQAMKEVEEFALNDPYYKNGIITSFVVKEWLVVIK